MRVRRVGVRELKAHASAILQELQRGDLEVLVTVRGRPVARIEALGPDEARTPPDGMGGLRGALTDFPRLEWEDFKAVAREWEPRPLDEE